MSIKAIVWSDTDGEFYRSEIGTGGLIFDYHWERIDNGDGTIDIKKKDTVDFISVGLWNLRPNGDVQVRASDQYDDCWKAVTIGGEVYIQAKAA